MSSTKPHTSSGFQISWRKVVPSLLIRPRTSAPPINALLFSQCSVSLPHQSCHICLFKFSVPLLLLTVFLLFHQLSVTILSLLASGLPWRLGLDPPSLASVPINTCQALRHHLSLTRALLGGTSSPKHRENSTLV